MNDFLLSSKTQGVLKAVRWFCRCLRIVVLVVMFWVVSADEWDCLGTRETTIGLAVVASAVIILGIAYVVYQRYFFEYQMPTDRVSVFCYLGLIITLVMTPMACHGLYVIYQALMLEQQATLSLQASQTYQNWYLLAGAARAISLRNAFLSSPEAALLEQIKGLHREIWYITCTLFAMAHSSAIALNIILTELPYKAEFQHWGEQEGYDS